MTIAVTPLTSALGAEIRGVDLSQPLGYDEFAAVFRAFLDHLVVFFPGQSLSPVQHRDFARRFGLLDHPKFSPPFAMPPVEGHPEIYQIIKEADDRSINIGGFWHADVTHRERPNLASIAYVKEAPTHGGDTQFANLYLAYEGLSAGMQRLLGRLRAVHSSAMPYGGGSVRSSAVARDSPPPPESPDFVMDQVERDHVETEHPVVRCHPDTGRKSLYVNRGFTSRFAGMTMEESRPLLEYLWSHAEQPEFTCRYRWGAGAVGIWDNRCVLHYALNDYYGERRVVHRISVNEPIRPS